MMDIGVDFSHVIDLEIVGSVLERRWPWIECSYGDPYVRRFELQWTLGFLFRKFVERRRVARSCGPWRLGGDAEALDDRARGVQFGHCGGDAESAAAHGALEDVRVERPGHECHPVDVRRGREERTAKESIQCRMVG